MIKSEFHMIPFNYKRFNHMKMKFNKWLLIALVGSLFACTGTKTKTETITETKAEQQGWKLSMQSYTFHLFSVVESLDKTKELGLQYIEIYPGQKMGEGFGDAVFGYALTSEQRQQLKELAKSKEVKIISSGVWTPARDSGNRCSPLPKMEMGSWRRACPGGLGPGGLMKRGDKVACHNHPNKPPTGSRNLLECIRKNPS